MSDISYISTQALVQELRKRKGVRVHRIPPNAPFFLDGPLTGPGFFLFVGDDA